MGGRRWAITDFLDLTTSSRWMSMSGMLTIIARMAKRRMAKECRLKRFSDLKDCNTEIDNGFWYQIWICKQTSEFIKSHALSEQKTEMRWDLWADGGWLYAVDELQEVHDSLVSGRQFDRENGHCRVHRLQEILTVVVFSQYLCKKRDLCKRFTIQGVSFDTLQIFEKLG